MSARLELSAEIEEINKRHHARLLELIAKLKENNPIITSLTICFDDKYYHTIPPLSISSEWHIHRSTNHTIEAVASTDLLSAIAGNITLKKLDIRNFHYNYHSSDSKVFEFFTSLFAALEKNKSIQCVKIEGALFFPTESYNILPEYFQERDQKNKALNLRFCQTILNHASINEIQLTGNLLFSKSDLLESVLASIEKNPRITILDLGGLCVDFSEKTTLSVSTSDITSGEPDTRSDENKAKWESFTQNLAILCSYIARTKTLVTLSLNNILCHDNTGMIKIFLENLSKALNENQSVKHLTRHVSRFSEDPAIQQRFETLLPWVFGNRPILSEAEKQKLSGERKQVKDEVSEDAAQKPPEAPASSAAAFLPSYNHKDEENLTVPSVACGSGAAPLHIDKRFH